jgi:hypothetical protein
VLLAQGRVKGWPRCPFRPGHAIPGNEAAYRLFAETASDEDLRLAVIALEQIVPPGEER